MWKYIQERFESSDSFLSLALGLAVVLAIGMLAFNYFTQNQPAPAKTAAQVDNELKAAAINSLPTTYTVKAGDTLWSISEQFYKNGYNWVDLVKVNKLANSNAIEAGQVLTIPSIAAAQPSLAPTSKGQVSSAMVEKIGQKDKNYKVVSGDTLWAIAVKEYNSGYRWVEIAKVNKLVNPDLIHAGNDLVLP